MSSELAGFSREIDTFNLMPLWERTKPMRPGSPCVPAHWRYADMRPLLMRAAGLITAREAERRVLVLENPGLRGSTYVTNSLFAGLQIIMPGEIAAAHRHTPSALRFIVEGEGAYTAVAGERTAMRPGDFVVTPNWAWHDHGNPGAEPVVWMDGLDTPFAQFFGAIFREDSAGETPSAARHAGDAAAGDSANLLPVDCDAGPASPVLRYPYERTRESLEQLAREGPPDPAHGVRLRYANPASGRYPFPTMAAFMQWLPAGFAGRDYRSTDGTVFNVVEGSGSVQIGGQHYAFAPHDVFVAPPWTPYRFNAGAECVLFSFSDRAGQESLGFWRERFD